MANPLAIAVAYWLMAGSPLPPGVNYSCEDVRGYVATNGRAWAWARAVEMIAQGQLTWAQLRVAKRCMDSPKGAKATS